MTEEDKIKRDPSDAPSGTQADEASATEKTGDNDQQDYPSPQENENDSSPSDDPSPKEEHVSHPSDDSSEDSGLASSARPTTTTGETFKKVLGSKRGKIGLIAILIALVVLVLFATHVLCLHDWQEATCTQPETCSICNRTQGAALGHDWTDATCTEPETCTRCGLTQGKPLGHDVKNDKWETVKKATCTEEGKLEGVCERCGETISLPIEKTDHKYGEWKVTKKATCSEEGSRERVCSQCGKKQTESIEKTDHKPGSWEVVEDYVIGDNGYVESGEQEKTCTVCGEIVDTREYTVDLTLAQENAATKALDYIDLMAFSRSGLIEQLEFEGYSHEDATLVTDHIGVDWDQQAEFKAREYLDAMSFSRDGLIGQLEHDGFTHDQAVYGVDKVGL